MTSLAEAPGGHSGRERSSVRPLSLCWRRGLSALGLWLENWRRLWGTPQLMSGGGRGPDWHWRATGE